MSYLSKHVDREILRAAVGRQIIDPISEQVLDIKTAVYFEHGGRPYCVSGKTYDFYYRGDSEFANTITNVIDGREL